MSTERIEELENKLDELRTEIRTEFVWILRNRYDSSLESEVSERELNLESLKSEYDSTENELNKVKQFLIDDNSDSGKIVYILDTNEITVMSDSLGEIKYAKYHPGKFLVAWHPKSSIENEKTTVVVKNNTVGPILFRQIAGAVARRIVMYSKKGQNVTQGTEMGFIKFGSRIDIFLPINAKIKTKINEKVRGGETIIASCNPQIK